MLPHRGVLPISRSFSALSRKLPRNTPTARNRFSTSLYKSSNVSNTTRELIESKLSLGGKVTVITGRYQTCTCYMNSTDPFLARGIARYWLNLGQNSGSLGQWCGYFRCPRARNECFPAGKWLWFAFHLSPVSCLPKSILAYKLIQHF